MHVQHCLHHLPPALMVQGTTSDAGKSTLVCGLLRLLARQGIPCAPFKPQNMALNSAVTIDGGEIGRAQALQAQAARVPPQIDFNPILLKPTSDQGSQVIIHGRAIGTLSAREYHAYKPTAMQSVLQSWHRLRTTYRTLVVEGAGSPAEINLRANDIANMGFAEAADLPVLLIADIDRGGVFAHLTGTLQLLTESERARVKGFIINRFRGDPALLQSGIDWLEQHTGKPVLGILPYLHGLHLDAEDSLAVQPRPAHHGTPDRIRILAPALPRLSNHTDCDVWQLNPAVDFRWIGEGDPIPPADLILLPGSKNVRADLGWLRQQGWEPAIARHLRYGGKLLGICGGYQMLGQTIADPDGLEGSPGQTPGLGWLNIHTRLLPEKTLTNTTATFLHPAAPTGSEPPQATGYEIHLGESHGEDTRRPALRLPNGRGEGATSSDGQVIGTYLHGLCDRPAVQQALLHWAAPHHAHTAQPIDRETARETALDRLADTLAKYLDWTKFAAALCSQ